MPYIKQADREVFDQPCADIANAATCAGDLNFAITTIIHHYIARKGMNYENLNSVNGMLDCCKQEFYRRVIAPYEDSKIEINGDVMEVNVTRPDKS